MSEDAAAIPADIQAAFESLAAGIAELPSSFTLPIDPPIPHSGTAYDQIILREPKADHVRKAEEQLRNGPHLPHNRRNYEMHLVANVSGAPFAVVQQIGVARLNVAMAYLNSFLDYGQGTGAI